MPTYRWMLPLALLVSSASCVPSEGDDLSSQPETDEISQPSVGSWSTYGSSTVQTNTRGLAATTPTYVYSIGMDHSGSQENRPWRMRRHTSSSSSDLFLGNSCASWNCWGADVGASVIGSTTDVYHSNGAGVVENFSSNAATSPSSPPSFDGPPGATFNRPAYWGAGQDIFFKSGSSVAQIYRPNTSTGYSTPSITSTPGGTTILDLPMAATWSEQNGTHRAHVFVPTSSGIIVMQWSGSTWAWSTVYGTSPSSGLAVVDEGSGNLRLFWLNSSGNIFAMPSTDNGTTWGSITSLSKPSVGFKAHPGLSGKFTSPTAVRSSGATTVYGIGTDSRIYEYTLLERLRSAIVPPLARTGCLR